MATHIPAFTTTPSRRTPSTFSADMDTRLSEENARIAASNTQADENDANADAAETHAAEAAAGAGTATTQAGIATARAVLTAADAIATAADRVQTGLDRVAAAASAGSAAAIAGAFVGTSTTSWTPAVESKAFTTQAGEQYSAGIFVTIVSAAAPSAFGFGQVFSYSGATLTVDVQYATGSGAHTDWNISLAGARGATGPTGPTGPESLPTAAAGGTVDAITATFSPAITLTDRQKCCVVCAGASTSTTPTFAPNGEAAHTITARGGAALLAGDIPAAGFAAILVYNSANTRWELLNPSAAGASGTVTAPSIAAPADDATGVSERPTLTTSAFAMTGDIGDVAHYATQWQVRAAAGDWVTPAYDSGEDTTNKTSLVLPAGNLDEGENEYYLRARHRGTIWGWSEYSAEIHITTAATFANIIGVCCTATGGGGGTWVHIDAAGNTIATPATSVFNAHPVWGGMTDVTIDGQAMITVPKFYIKRAVISGGANNGKEAWWISDVLTTGFAIHPAFRNANADIAQFYYGKYQAHDDGTKLESHSATAPVVSISLTNVIAHAAARNAGGVTGFMALSVFQWAAIQWLYLVENATMDSQTKTGAGRVTEASAANVDAADVAQATYRGIVGLWGNVWQWMDGLKTDANGHINLWDRAGNKGWVDTGLTRSAAAGTIYPTTFMASSGAGFDFDDVFIGDTGPTSNSDATAPDYQYFTTSECFPIVGGYWSNAAAAGLWSVSCSYAATNASTLIGARLAKV